MEVKEIIQEVTDKIQKNATVKVVFGDPIKEKGTTIIPVASINVRGGGGGGFGEDQTKEEKKKPTKGGGMGLGINVISRPVGYIEITDEGARFVEIIDKAKVAVFGIIASAVAVIFLSKSFGSCCSKK